MRSDVSSFRCYESNKCKHTELLALPRAHAAKQLASGSKTLAIKQASSKTVQRGPINSFWYHFVTTVVLFWYYCGIILVQP